MEDGILPDYSCYMKRDLNSDDIPSLSSSYGSVDSTGYGHVCTAESS